MNPSRDEQTAALIGRIRVLLGEQLEELVQPRANRLYLTVKAAHIKEAARLFSGQLHARLQTASAVDAPHRIEILYHWAFDCLALVVTVRTFMDREQPVIATISDVCPAAEWIEREMAELMGIEFQGHPDMRHLLLREDWPQGKYPLRRDYRKE
jgi:NADH:ubiquinone oxidoreductase subunit C